MNDARPGRSQAWPERSPSPWPSDRKPVDRASTGQIEGAADRTWAARLWTGWLGILGFLGAVAVIVCVPRSGDAAAVLGAAGLVCFTVAVAHRDG